MPPKEPDHILENLHLKEYESLKEVADDASASGKKLVVRNGFVYDIEEFLEVVKHPGGKRVVEREIGKDIGEIMIKNAHSKNAYDMLELYKTGFIKGQCQPTSLDSRATNERLQSLNIDPKHLEGALKKLDLSKGLFYQIWSLDLSFQEYLAFIHDPKIINKDVQFFDTPWMEPFTKTPWYLIPAVYIPIILVSLFINFDTNTSYGLQIFLFLMGILVWTLLEYLIHRFIFHYVETNRDAGRIMRTIHFMFHGIHHAYPLDKYRLVFPPTLGVIVAAVLHMIILAPFLYPKIGFVLGAGGIFGYVIYDITHYWIHHSRAENFYLEWVKRNHNRHHYRNPTLGYGVSTPIWDYVFRTVIN